MSDRSVVPKIASIAVRDHLERAGCYVRVGDLTHEWAARITATGGLANPQFRLSNQSSPSRAAMIFQCPSDPAMPDQLIGAICWRFHETDSYIREFEQGWLYYDDPASHGWPTLLTGLRDDLSNLRGLICTRGAITSFRDSSKVGEGWRLIWWLSIFPMIEAIEQRIDYQIGIPWEHIALRDAPRKWYGYQHQAPTRPLMLPFTKQGVPVMKEPSRLYFAWSDFAETLEILRRRANRLQSASNDHLRDIAIPDDKLDQTQEVSARRG